MTDVVNPKSASPDQLLPYHKKISAEGKALMKCFISYTYMVLKSTATPRDYGTFKPSGVFNSQGIFRTCQPLPLPRWKRETMKTRHSILHNVGIITE